MGCYKNETGGVRGVDFGRSFDDAPRLVSGILGISCIIGIWKNILDLLKTSYFAINYVEI